MKGFNMRSVPLVSPVQFQSYLRSDPHHYIVPKSDWEAAVKDRALLEKYIRSDDEYQMDVKPPSGLWENVLHIFGVTEYARYQAEMKELKTNVRAYPYQITQKDDGTLAIHSRNVKPI